jgi:hypothetical protein
LRGFSCPLTIASTTKKFSRAFGTHGPALRARPSTSHSLRSCKAQARTLAKRWHYVPTLCTTPPRRSRCADLTRAHQARSPRYATSLTNNAPRPYRRSLSIPANFCSSRLVVEVLVSLDPQMPNTYPINYPARKLAPISHPQNCGTTTLWSHQRKPQPGVCL